MQFACNLSPAWRVGYVLFGLALLAVGAAVFSWIFWLAVLLGVGGVVVAIEGAVGF